MNAPRLARRLLPLVLAATACRAQSPRNPEDLRSALIEALEHDDPNAAYALLAPSVQAKVSQEEFRARWIAQPKARQQLLKELKGLPKEASQATYEARTTHSDGTVLSWAQVEGEFVVVDGLPRRTELESPTATLRAFVATLRSNPPLNADDLLSEDAQRRMRDDWEKRADLIENALRDPEALRLSADGAHAVLTYAEDATITLERKGRRWLITELR